MTRVAIALLAVIACGKAKDPPSSPTGATTTVEPAAAPAAALGLQVKHVVPEFSGTYDLALAQLSSPDNETVIAFVRGCPKLTCEIGAWEPGQIAAVCPKAFLATIHVPG